MTEQIVQGKSGILTASFVDSAGNSVDPDTVKVAIKDPSNATIIASDTPGRRTLGEYFYVYTPVASAPTGAWHVNWTFVVGGVAQPVISEVFNVLAAGSAESAEDAISYLRMLVDEVIPAGGTELDTAFTDEYLGWIFELKARSFYAAASDLWAAKAGKYAKLVDVDESGSSRKLSQVYKNMVQQSQLYATRAQQELDAATAAGGAAPVAVSWLNDSRRVSDTCERPAGASRW